MSVRSPGYGQMGPAGAVGPAGPKGDTGAQGVQGVAGPKGDAGTAGAVGPAGPQGVKGDTGATGPVGPQGPKGDTGATGPAGAGATLGTSTPQALGTAAAGTSANASREDHVHALPSGRLVLVGNVTVTETTLLSVAIGMKRMTLPLTGIATADMGKLIVVPNGTSTAGCEVQNAYPAAANSVSIGYFTPALGIGTTYSIPVSVYRVT